jgi:iron complex outermembrane receptor protein
LYANGAWRPSERTESRFYLTYVENELELPGALSPAQLESDPGQANAAALTGHFQLDVETLRPANKTVFELGADERLELGFSVEGQSLYHPIVDVRVDSDGAGPALPTQVFALLVATDHEELGGMLRYGKRAGRHDLLLGMSYGRGTVQGGDYWNDAGTPAFLMTAVNNRATRLALYALDRWQLTDALMVELGAQGVAASRDVVNSDAESGQVRELRDDFSRINPRVGLVYSATESVDLFANASALYEAPTNYELEDEASGGNSILDAMHGTVLEVGTRGKSTASAIAWSWEVAVYYAAIEDEILSIDDPAAPGTSLSANIGNTTHAGVEALVSAALPVGGRDAMLVPQLSLTLNDFSFDADPLYRDNDLPAAPRHVLRGELLYRHPKGWFAGPTIDVVAERFADFANSYRIGSYSLLGMRAGWANDRWSFYGEVVNVADERYVATVGVRAVAQPDDELLNPGSPRSAYFGVTTRF